jgi:hypothetical protein
MGVWLDRQQARRRERAIDRRQRDAETGSIVWHELDPEEANHRERARRRRRRRTVAGSIGWAVLGLLGVFIGDEMLWVGLGLIVFGVTNALVTLRMIGREPRDDAGADG